MERKLIICPETAHPEQIEYDTTACGILITACSRFEPHADVECMRLCAAKLDRQATDESERDVDDDTAEPQMECDE